jgi:2,5-diketo-D-gluconate reductase A
MGLGGHGGGPGRGLCPLDRRLEPVVAKIAERVARTPAQVLLRWCIQRHTIVLPKSTHRERIEENAQIFDFVLSDEDVAELDALDQTGGTDRARESKWW